MRQHLEHFVGLQRPFWSLIDPNEITGGDDEDNIVKPKFSGWSKTELWQVVDVEPMPVFGKFYNG